MAHSLSMSNRYGSPADISSAIKTLNQENSNEK